MRFIYPATIERLDGEILVRFPDFPEALTGGSTLAEATDLAADALDEVVLARLASGEGIPAPSNSSGLGEILLVTLDPVTAARAAVSGAMAEARLSKSALARMMGRDEKVVRRILDGRQGIDMGTAMGALQAMGWTAALEVEKRTDKALAD